MQLCPQLKTSEGNDFNASHPHKEQNITPAKCGGCDIPYHLKTNAIIPVIKTEFTASLLLSSDSHDPLEIILLI